MKNSTNWKKVIQNLIYSIYGGFIGALFGLYAIGNHNGKQLWWLAVLYGIIVIFIIWLTEFKN